jgi:intracellular sulfur oxidation DsrE/DsrF family protein
MKNKVILVTSDEFGTGDAALGKSVLETFFVLLKQRDELPAAVFCMNRGVFTLTDQSFASVHLAEMAAAGVPVFGCSTCVEHYGVAGDMKAGEISSLSAFIDLAARHEVLTIA